MGLVLSTAAELQASAVIHERRKSLETLAEILSSAYVWSSVCEDFKAAADLDRQVLTVRARLKAHYRADSVVFADADGNIKEDSEYDPTSRYSVETLVDALIKYHADLDASIQWGIVGGPERENSTGPTDFDIELKKAEIAEAEDIITIYSVPGTARLAYDLIADPATRVQWREGDPDFIDEDAARTKSENFLDFLKRKKTEDYVRTTGGADPIKRSGGLDLKTAADLAAEADGEDPAE